MSPTPVNFNWNSYLEAVKSSSPVVGTVLEKARHTLKDGKLYLYLARNYDRKILTSERNLAILVSKAAGQFSVEITENTAIFEKDPEYEKLSDIMGAGIEEVGSNGVPEFNK